MDNKTMELPNSWVMVKLGKFVESEKGKKPQSESKVETSTHNLPYVDIQAFEEGAIKSWTDGVGCRLCSEADFLMVWDGSRSGLVGKGMNGALGSTLVRINFSSMVNDYAFYFLQSKYQQINTRAKGSGTPHVDPDLLWNYEFPIPPKNEQHRIVAKIEALFSELDKGIESFKTAREQLKIYRQALLKHAFSGKLTEQWRTENQDKLETAEALLQRIQAERGQRYQQQLKDWEANGKQGGKPKAPKTLPPLTTDELADLPDLPTGWTWLKSGELFESVTSGSRGWAEYYADSGAIFIRITNLDFDSLKLDLSTKKIKYVQPPAGAEGLRTKVKEGDFLFSITGYLGMFAIAPSLDDAYVNQHISLARPLDGFSKKYFGYYVTSHTGGIHYLNKQTKGAVKAGLGLDNIQNFPVPMCSLNEQIKISCEIELRLSEVDQLDQTLTTALQQAVALRQSILKKAFSGQLVPQDPNDEPARVLLERIQAEKAWQYGQSQSRKINKRKTTA
ncbi:MAG: restriction endonuclease subunit S [Methylococcales bacterium]|nr:restriction endonuclease subunit S [Methylococcales bacterium]